MASTKSARSQPPFVGLSPTAFEKAFDDLRKDAKRKGPVKTLAETSMAMLRAALENRQ